MNNFVLNINTEQPKYIQIIKTFEEAILNGKYKRGDKLPSINSIKIRYSISRDTVLLAYSNLKSRGIIISIPGKGYYLKSEHIKTSHRVFLLFDEFNSFKEDLYNSLINNLGDNIEVDIFFHHFNINVFNKLIDDNIGIYNSYVIMPANLKNVSNIINKLPQERVYILDQTNEELLKYPAIFQNFRKNIFDSLSETRFLLRKYKKMVLLFSNKIQPLGMLRGFEDFCKEEGFDYEVIDSLDVKILEEGEVYLIPDDINLIRLIKKIKHEKFDITNNIGIISYNDTILKEIVEGGITTISTDFKFMGKRLAQMITNKERLQIENPNRLILRNSL